MPSDREQHDSDALKALAWDIERLAKNHVDVLRADGLDDLADMLERLAHDTRATAEEHDPNA